jgi:hypothetical protein
MRLNGYYLPPGIDVAPLRTKTFGPVSIQIPALTATTLSDLINRLEAAQQQYLARQPVERLLSICDEAVSRWLKPDDPHRRQADEALPAITGFSPLMIREGLTLMMEGLRANRMQSLLKEELGDPRFLDQFLPRMIGKSKAFGPRLITHVLTGNVPALSAAGIITSLLVKSASLVKTASDEPLFAALFARTLVEVEPALSDCLAVVGWKSGTNEAKSLEEVAFHRAELVVATGSEEALSDLKSRLSTHLTTTRFLGYGHRVSFGLIGREALTDLRDTANRAAYDVALYDQQGCLSPHLFYVETGGKHFPREFARALGEALSRLETKLPRGAISTQTAAALHHFRSRYEIKQADGQEISIFRSEKGNLWTVIYEDDPSFSLSPLFRTVRVKPIDDLKHVAPLLSHWRPYLQAAGMTVSPERLLPLADALGTMGVNRICPLGQMQKPSSGWHQDGRLTFSELVRWVDLENNEP